MVDVELCALQSILLLLPPEEDGHTAPACLLSVTLQGSHSSSPVQPVADRPHTSERDLAIPELKTDSEREGDIETSTTDVRPEDEKSHSPIIWNCSVSCNCAIRTHCLHLGVSPSNRGIS